MVQIDWKKIMAVQPEGMTEQDKDELYETVAWYLPEYSTDRKHLIQFVRVTQEILKFKSEQVDSLMNELDDIAARQGEEEARERQDLLDEIEQLKEQLEYQKRMGRDGGRSNLNSREELTSEVVKLEIQNEELVLELQQREKDLMKEKLETENLASQVATLEREKQGLKRELVALQEEAQERLDGRSLRDSPEFGPEKQEEMTELIRQKNRHITQLLDDIDILEKQNLSLRTKLTNVCDELADATSHINEMTMHLSQFKHMNEELEKKLSNSEDLNKSLQDQIEDLVEEKAKHDKQLDQFSEMFNSKLQEWKDILEAKDGELGKAEEEIRRLLATSSKYQEFPDLEMNKRIAEQEQQIINLKNELVRATHEINNCTEMIENFKERQGQMKFSDTDQFQAQVIVYEERIKHLEEKLKYAEEDAQAKAEEISEIVILLREYEMGEFGLSEAMVRIKQLEKMLEKRELQIEKLVESCNNMEIEFENVEEQNMALRERLGMSPSEEIDTSSVKLRFRKDLEVMETLKLQLDKKEEELIRVKLKYRKLVKFLKTQPQVSERSMTSSEELKDERQNVETIARYAEEKSNLENKLVSIIKENDALRKGMHEILESIQSQDSAGVVEIQSNCLERLLEALDSRHVSGWYHPAMRLQAQLNNAEGKNEELRKQIRSFRKVEMTKNSELQDAYVKIRNLESELFVLRSPREDVISKSKTPESEMEEEVEVGSNGKQSLTNVEQEQKIVGLEIEVQELKHSLNKAKAETDKLEKLRFVEQEELNSKITGLEKQVSALEADADSQVVDTSRLQAQLSVQERQVNFLKQLESTEREDNERLYKEMLQQEGKLLQEVLRVQSEKVGYLLKVEKLEKELLESVPKSKLNELNKELTDVTMKYQEVVGLNMSKYEDNTVESLEEEVRLLQREKNEVLDELRIAKEKLTISQVADSPGDELSMLAEKLAASEVRELNEKQKSAHLEKANLMLRSEMQELEAYNKEMSGYVEGMKELKEKLQQAEKEVTSRAESGEKECEALRERVANLKRRLRMSENEKDNFRELFEISQGQFRSFDNYREREKLRVSSLSDQVLLLQSSADEKAIVAKLSHELLTCQLSASQAAEEKSVLQDKVTKLLARNIVLESRIEEAREEGCEAKRKYMAEVENLHGVIRDLRKLYGTFTMFPNLEMVHKMKKRLREVQEEERRRVKDLKSEVQECSMKKDELAIKMEGLEPLMAAFRGDSKQLMAWYDNGTSLRLEEARCRRHNQFLSGELEQLENYIKRMDEEIISLEEANMNREKEWEQRQVLWEQSQSEMFDLLREKGLDKPKAVTPVQDESTQTASDEAEGIKKIVEDQAETIKKYETEMQKSEAEIEQLKRDLSEKGASTDGGIKDKPEKMATVDVAAVRDVSDGAEKAALRVTVQSLQTIIHQKEGTIYRYQQLLKEGRDEFTKSSGRLQVELRTLHEALTKQSKAYSKLKSSLETGQQLKEGLPKVFEKYLTKIHELEDEVKECQMTLAGVNGQLFAAQQDRDKWRSLAEERLSLAEETKQRLEMEHRNERDGYRAQIEHYQVEMERLQRAVGTVHHDGSGDHRKVCEEVEIQEKEVQYESDSSKDKPGDWSDKPPKRRDLVKELKTLERQLKFARDESTRLREQLRLSQVQKSKRPKTASSATSRSGSESKSSLKEDSLQSKVKTLEELLRIAKEREQDLIEGSQRRIKSAEEVARWGERKKSQQTIQSLNGKLKEREAEIEILKNKNESFRNMIHKYERDRNALEMQLKASKGGPSSLQGKVDKLMEEKAQLEREVTELREKLEMQQRHESGIGAAVLYDKLESQERKLAVLELASKGRSTIVEELEKLQLSYTNLEKSNLRLESENLALHLAQEKDKSTIKRLMERIEELEKLLLAAEEESEMRQQESNRTISSLNERIGRISEARKNARNGQSSRLTPCPEKLRKDYAKLKEDHKALRAKYLEAVDKNHELEDELKKCRYQIRLLEEKDLADSISKTNNLELASQLSQELLQVKAQLTHKSNLLNRVKVLLTKAAAKEKALNERVSALETMVPSDAGNGGDA